MVVFGYYWHHLFDKPGGRINKQSSFMTLEPFWFKVLTILTNMMLDPPAKKRSRVGSLATSHGSETLEDGPGTVAETFMWPIYYMTILFSHSNVNGQDPISERI